MKYLHEGPDKTLCEWKGYSKHYDVMIGKKCTKHAAWRYPWPLTDVIDFTFLKDYIAFYPYDLDCTLGGEKVLAQRGGYYGGWITKEILGPFKGPPGTESW